MRAMKRGSDSQRNASAFHCESDPPPHLLRVRSQLGQAGSWPTFQACAEVRHPLLACSVRLPAELPLDACVDPAVAGRLRGWIAGRGHAEKRLVDVAVLDRALLFGPLGERTCEAVGHGLVVVRAA